MKAQYEPNIPEAEANRRRIKVRDYKLFKADQGLNPELSPEELDVVLEPPDNRRARCRIAGIPYRIRKAERTV